MSSYQKIEVGGKATMRISDEIIIKDCIVLAEVLTQGKVLYTVAVPTKQSVDEPNGFNMGGVVTSTVFINGMVYVRWENLDGAFFE